MLRLLEARIWLDDHPTPEIHVLATCTPTELIDRQRELQQLLATAPADQRQLHRPARQLTARRRPRCTTTSAAAIAIQDARRDWIITNWPHLVELEQVTQLIATQEPLAHWPTAQPERSRDVLDQLRRLAPTPRRSRGTHLSPNSTGKRPTATPYAASRPAATTSASSPPAWRRPPSRKPSSTRLTALTGQLRAARRERSVERAFDRYRPNEFDLARATRITTLAHDALTTQPAWVVDHIRQPPRQPPAPGRDVADLA